MDAPKYCINTGHSEDKELSGQKYYFCWGWNNINLWWVWSSFPYIFSSFANSSPTKILQWHFFHFLSLYPHFILTKAMPGCLCNYHYTSFTKGLVSAQGKRAVRVSTKVNPSALTEFHRGSNTPQDICWGLDLGVILIPGIICASQVNSFLTWIDTAQACFRKS